MKITGKLKTDVPAPRPKPPTTQPPTRKARQLALAYWIERKIDSGELDSYAHAARVLGVSRARVSQVVRLVGLPVETQEGILTGDNHPTERRLRPHPRGRRTRGAEQG